MQDVYRAVREPASTEMKVKGSRFIAEVFPVDGAGEAENLIKAVRRREYAATHHCTAFRVGKQGEVSRYDDDGEPSGTAGPPILRQIDARGLTNTLVVVTRYFGGTKLGTGGLIRAYGDAAAEVLQGAKVAEHVIRIPLQLTYAYADTSPLMHLVSRFDAVPGEASYGNEARLIVAVRRSEADAFCHAFVDALSGRGAISEIDPERAP